MYLEELGEKIFGEEASWGSGGLENSRMECKARLNRQDVLGWLKTVAGFSNARGGVLYIGVEDKTNKLLGFDRKEADNERNYFNQQAMEHLSPFPPIKIDFLSYKLREKERYILRILVSESPAKPVILKYQGIPSIYMRREGFTNGATYEEIISMSLKSSRLQYDAGLSNALYDRTKFSKLLAFYEEHNERPFSEKAMRSLGFFDKEGTLYNGALLFQDDYQGGKTAVQCSLFSGVNRGSTRILAINHFSGPLTDSIEYMMTFVEQRMNHAVVKMDNAHVNIDAYPVRALFEGIINAIAHRDYYLDGTQIQVDMFKDRLEISSPGGFYQGEVFGKSYDLSNIISKRRNELICGVLVACKVMEAAGTGFDKIMEEYADADESHKPYIFSATDHFTLVLPDLTYQDGIADTDLPKLRFAEVSDGSKYDEKILSFCYYKARKSSEIAEHIGIRDSSYFRKNILDNLVSQGYLDREKVSRAWFYKADRGMVELGE